MIATSLEVVRSFSGPARAHASVPYSPALLEGLLAMMHYRLPLDVDHVTGVITGIEVTNDPSSVSLSTHKYFASLREIRLTLLVIP